MAKQTNRRNNRNRNGGKDDKKVQNMNSRRMNRRNSSKNERREKEAIDSLLEESKTNDYSWYAKFPQFTKDAGTLAFGIPLGQPISVGNSDLVTIPGIMKIMFCPGIGWSEDLTSPVNRMAIKFYTFLRDVQKSAAKYDSADIMMYLLAVDSLMMFHSMLRRAYGVAQLFTPVNKYYPKQLLQFMGFDASITENLAEFRAYINRLGLMLGSYCIPLNFDITVRHQWMCEGLYLDSNTTRAQTYVFVPEGFWKFNNTVATGSELDLVRWQSAGGNNTLHTFAEIKEIGSELINAILGDQDTGNIAGDLYAAYGADKLFKVTEVPENYAILPSYNETVLSQIENLTICGEITGNPIIAQEPGVNNGAITYKPYFDGGAMLVTTEDYTPGMAGLSCKPINLHWDSPTAEQVIEATRLAACSTQQQKPSSADMFQYDLIGSDVVTRLWIGVFNPDNPQALSSIFLKSQIVNISSSIAANNLIQRIQFVALAESFDWAPDLWLATFDENGVMNITQPCFDADNLTVASATQLSMMHEAALLSMLDVPQMGM